MIERRHIEVFLAIVDAGSMSRAADEMRVSQPSISQAVASLERQLGAKVFKRTSTGAALTEIGSRLVEPARAIMDNFDAVARTGSTGSSERARLNITMPSILARHPGIAVISEFIRRHQDVTVRVNDQTSVGGVWEDVVRAKSEIGFTTTPEDASVVTVPLGHHRIKVAFPPNDAPPNDEPLTRQELSALTVVTGLPKGAYTRRILGRALADRELFLRQVVETSHRHTVEDFVLAGVGPALMIAPEADVLAQRGAVVREISPPIDRPFFLIHSKRRLSPAAEHFVAVCRQVCQAEELGSIPSDR
ncbi:LysR family transcriptional regulator [Aeromicrobium phragmitis]|uniref:LysR family transcriptional regulator n=1 Tax=Aeromicrobium phragmitis TaxID=2478914 RepID=A0A3L8PS77_9ACTN|nr:LysR family transcriptional regulator [Aeromicrobium phragmitis]RLV57248.1 LysR family transcriptional regulator [Aeromicrobium phragmitis]